MTKTFNRWARKVVSDTDLCKAVREIEATRIIAAGLQLADAPKLDALMAAEILKEA